MGSIKLRFPVFINREIIIPVFFIQLYFQADIDPEIETKLPVQLPAKLIILYRSNYTKQMGITEKVFGHFRDVQF
jgi:hypothetical protein